MSGFKFTGFPSSLKSESIREAGLLFKGLATASGFGHREAGSRGSSAGSRLGSRLCFALLKLVKCVIMC